MEYPELEKNPTKAYRYLCTKCNSRFLGHKPRTFNRNFKENGISYYGVKTTRNPDCPSCRSFENVVQSNEVKGEYVNNQKQRELAPRKTNDKLIIFFAVLLVILLYVGSMYYGISRT